VLNSDWHAILIECIGWASTGSFLYSIVVKNRRRLHQIGVFASITTGIYGYAHGATAIWVKWSIAFFFHLYMIRKSSTASSRDETESVTNVPL
jgi:hypothetical protein